jgi:hypothetical protein
MFDMLAEENNESRISVFRKPCQKCKKLKWASQDNYTLPCSNLAAD